MNKFATSASVATLVVAAGLVISAATAKQAAAQTSWEGFYVGAHLGGGESQFDGLFKGPAPSDSNVPFDDLEPAGLLGGGQIGYNWDHGNWVFGVEADVSLMDWSDTATAPSSSENATADADLLASIRGRIGVPVGDNRQGLLFATAGVAFPDIDVTVRDRDIGSAGLSQQKISFDDVGGVFGGGFEVAFTDNIRLRGEGLYYWFDDSQQVTLQSAAAGDFVKLEDAWSARFAINWYFNGPGPGGPPLK